MKNMVKPALGTKNKTAGHSYVTVVNLCALVNDGQHLFFFDERWMLGDSFWYYY